MKGVSSEVLEYVGSGRWVGRCRDLVGGGLQRCGCTKSWVWGGHVLLRF